jgi:hypothetical protein
MVSRARPPIWIAVLVAASFATACTVGNTRLVPRIARRAPPIVVSDPTSSIEPEPDPSRGDDPFLVMVRGEW